MKAVVGRLHSSSSRAAKSSGLKPTSLGVAFSQAASGALPVAAFALALRNGAAKTSDFAATRRVSIVVSSSPALLFSMSARDTIPIIDLGPYLAGEPGALQEAGRQLRVALTEIGFYYIVNHGIPRAQTRAIYDAAARFHAMPPAA